MVAVWSTGAIVALAVFVVIMVVVFLMLLQKARRSSR
jgi:hypothetical protein